MALDHVGLNHLTWERAAFVDGADRLPELIAGHGAEIAERDRPTRAQEVAWLERELLAMYADPALDTKPELPGERGGAFYSEAAVALLAALVSDAGTPRWSACGTRAPWSCCGPGQVSNNFGHER